MKNRIETPVGKLMVNEVLKSRLYHKVMIGSKKECDIGNMWQIVENDTFCDKN